MSPPFDRRPTAFADYSVGAPGGDDLGASDGRGQSTPPIGAQDEGAGGGDESGATAKEGGGEEREGGGVAGDRGREEREPTTVVSALDPEVHTVVLGEQL